MTNGARKGKVSVVGAGFYGSTTALRLAEYDIFESVVLTDIVEGKPEGIALDMNQSRPIEGFETAVIGQTTTADGEGYDAIAGSNVVVITAGLPRKPGMSRMDLIEVNAKIVRGVAENVAKNAPNAVVIVVSNPLDEMTALTQLATGFPKHQVLGQAGMLDTARFSNFVATQLKRAGRCGAHPDTWFARRHDGAGSIRVLGDDRWHEASADRAVVGRRHRRPGDTHAQRRRRNRCLAEDRFCVLRTVGGGGPHGDGSRARIPVLSCRYAHGSTVSTASAVSTSV